MNFPGLEHARLREFSPHRTGLVLPYPIVTPFTVKFMGQAMALIAPDAVIAVINQPVDH
jgi:hypothetical protein